MYDLSPYSIEQLMKEVRYQRQFAGIKGTNYHRQYIQSVASEIRNRLR